MITHSSILAWEIPQTEEPGGLQSRKESDTTEWLNNSNNQARSVGISCSESPAAFREGVLKGRWGRGVWRMWSVCSFLIGGWWGSQVRSQGVNILIFRPQPAWGLHAILCLTELWFLQTNWEMCVRLGLSLWDTTGSSWGWFTVEIIVISLPYSPAFVSAFLGFSNHSH